MPILKASNLTLTEDQPNTTLTASSAIGATTLTVGKVSGFVASTATNVKFFLLGEWGDDDADIVRSSTAAGPSGTTITLLTDVPLFTHTVGTKVTQIDYNAIEFSFSATVGGTKVGAVDVDIQASSQYTIKDSIDVASFSTYAVWYYRYKNDVNSTPTYSSYSGEYVIAGLAANSVEQLKQETLDMTDAKIDDFITDEFLLNQLNNWQREVQRLRDWSWEMTQTTSTTVVGQLAYDIPTTFKYTHEGSGVTQIRINGYEALESIDKREFDNYLTDTTYTTLASNVALVDTTITLTDSSDLTGSGSIVIGTDEIAYTANNTTTNVLSGVTGIDAIHTAGDTVWQESDLNQPLYWTLYENHIYLYPVCSNDYTGLALYIDHYKTLTNLTTDASITSIPFYYLAPFFLAWKIEMKKNNKDKADYWRQIYENRMAGEVRRDSPVYYYRFTLARPKGMGN